jgi:predicted phosphodiesterase
MQIADLVESYMNRMQGDFANRTLARKIVAENPHLFPDQSEKEIGSVRLMIRYRRGAAGSRERHYARPQFVRDEQLPSEYMKDFLGKGDRVSKGVWELPDHKKVLIMSDLHIPYHHLPAIEVCLDYALKKDIDAIYINGDLIDFYKISRWIKDPKRRGIQSEIDMTRNFLEGLTGFGLPIYWKMGNHEERWNSYFLQNAPELSDLDAIQLDNVFALDELGIELIDHKRVKFGSLNVIHGHEFGQSFFNPVNPARGLFLRAKTSTIAGHNHQTSSHHENNINGKQTACFSTGCLCDLEPEYRPMAYTKWNHGAAIIELEPDYFKVNNFRIIEGRVV